MDRAAWKIIVEKGGKHPASLTSWLYLPREKGGKGLQSVEHEYKITKIKMKLYQNSNQTVEAVREFEEHAMASGHQSLVKEAAKYAEELNITLQLDFLNPLCVKTEIKRYLLKLSLGSYSLTTSVLPTDPSLPYDNY